jgi:hypothetical protein
MGGRHVISIDPTNMLSITFVHAIAGEDIMSVFYVGAMYCWYLSDSMNMFFITIKHDDNPFVSTHGYQKENRSITLA